MEEGINMKKKQVIAIIATVVVIAGAGSAIVYANYNGRYDVKKETVIIEYGSTYTKTEASRNLDANEKNIKNSKFDFSKVDTMKEGTYKVTATCGKKKVSYKIQVKDTVNPEVKLKPDIRVVVGKELCSRDIAEKIEDLAGIESIAFRDGQTETTAELQEGETIAPIFCKYDKVGTMENVLVVTDKNGNITEMPFTVTVIEDYAAHVQGIADRTVTVGDQVDWMKGVTYDDKILSVTPDTNGVDLNKPGTYKVKYTILGNDNTTKVEKEITVTVKEKPKTNTQTSGTNSSSGGSRTSISSSNKGSSSGGSYSKGSSSGSNSTNSGNSGNSSSGTGSGGSSSGGWNPGQSWGGSTTVSGNFHEENGGSYEGGTWNPFG